MTPASKTSISNVLTVGQVAKRSGVAVSTLHFYESKGLIQSWRNSGGQRRYPREVLRSVAIIKTAQRLGIPLADIAEALSAMPDNRKPTAEDWHRLSQQWQQQLDKRINQLQQLRDQLDTCIGCGCLSLEHCPLRNPGDIAAASGSGAIFLEQGRCQQAIKSEKT